MDVGVKYWEEYERGAPFPWCLSEIPARKNNQGTAVDLENPLLSRKAIVSHDRLQHDYRRYGFTDTLANNLTGCGRSRRPRPT